MACKQNINLLFKQYKKDKLSNGVSGENHHESKFYDSLDQCWHINGSVMKHVTVNANDTNLPGGPEFETNSTQYKMKVEEFQNLTPEALRK